MDAFAETVGRGTGMILVGVLCFLIGGVVGIVLSAAMMASGRWEREEPLYKPEYKVVVQKAGVKVVGAAMTIDRYKMIEDPEDMTRFVKGRLAELMAEKLVDMIDIETHENLETNSVEYMARLRVVDTAFKF